GSCERSAARWSRSFGCFLRLLSRLAGQRHDAQLVLPQDRVDTGDLALDGPQSTVVVQLPGGSLEAQVEQLFLRLLELADQVLGGLVPQLLGGRGLRHYSHTSRFTNLHRIGSLCIARRKASLATGSGTPASSNMTRPGLTGATHHSGEPLPEPIRVSAGFLVSGRSGKMLIHTLPPRLM